MTSPSFFTHLRDALAALYPNQDDARVMVDAAGLDSNQITFSDQAQTNWHNILTAANRQNRLVALLTIAHAAYPEHPALQVATTHYQQFLEQNGQMRPPASPPSEEHPTATIATGGGTHLTGEVTTGNDFIGRDQYVADEVVQGDKTQGDKIYGNKVVYQTLPPPIPNRSRWMIPVGWGAMIATLLILGFWLVPLLQDVTSPGVPALSPTIVSPLTPTANAPTLQPTNSAGVSRFPTLPAYAPPLTTTLQITEMQDCSSIRDEIVATLKAVFSDTIPLVSIDNADTPAQSPLDLVISCQGENEVTRLQFALQVVRGAPIVYEPARLTLDNLDATQAARFAYALTQYLRRDYAEAANTFTTLSEFPLTAESKALAHLMRGNSLIFRHRYADAAAAYQAALTYRPDWAGATHNLGVAQMNQAWETYEFIPALTSFSQTLQIDPDFALSAIARGELWRWTGIVTESSEPFQQAEQACQTALTAHDPYIVAYATVCLANIQISRYSLNLSETPPTINATQLKTFATPYWSLPLMTIAANDYLLWQHYQDLLAKTRATSELWEAYQQGQDDVHLESSRSDYAAIRLFLNELHPQ